MSTLVLITSAPTSVHAWHALGLVQMLVKKQQACCVFFYQDGVHVANELQWFPEDQRNLCKAWQQLGIRLPVCVSAALNRGISDADNAKRHQLQSSNLAANFELVGLGELASALQSSERIIQF